MSVFRGVFRIASVIAFMAASVASAQTTVDEQPLGPDGDVVGASVSPHGNHVAVLVVKGSRYAVVIDGVEGPKIEALFQGIYLNAYQAGSSWQGKIPVLFSDDGSHSAYIAKMGNEFVVFEDGKESSRAPLGGNGLTTVPLEFSAGGKHLIYMEVAPTGGYQVVVDGTPGPVTGIPMPLVVSPDGEHYAYTGFEHASLGNGIPNWAVVDGRKVNFIGDQLQYTARNVLVSRISADGNSILVLNGKPAIKANVISPLWISDDGMEVGMVITPNPQTPSFLTVNGKVVPGTQGVGVSNVYFSPDGKRYAALCNNRSGGTSFMIIDGKKGEEYQTIPQQLPWNNALHWQFGTADTTTLPQAMRRTVPGFTADSSKFVYVAQQGGRCFMNVEDNESSGFQQFPMYEPTLSATGNRIGWIGVAPNNVQHIILDDKDITLSPSSSTKQLSCLMFSPGHEHYAYIEGQSVALDGVNQPGVIDGANYVFSPDGNHLGYFAHVSNQPCFVVDGKVVATGLNAVTNAFFSPDSQHIVWLSRGAIPGSRDSHKLFVDGKQVTHYGDTDSFLSPIFEFGTDGALTFVARTDDNLRRFRVTMPSSNLSALLAASPAAK
jgi:hypothetical protein